MASKSEGNVKVETKPTAKKRTPGRPRKSPTSKVRSNPTVKRGRGRPKKIETGVLLNAPMAKTSDQAVKAILSVLDDRDSYRTRAKVAEKQLKSIEKIVH